jgi:hypothetical protein
MQKKLFVFVQIILGLIINFAANAETFRYFGPPNVSTTSINPAAGAANYFEFVYNSDTKTLRWVGNFAAAGGKLANGFHMAFNDGPNPKGIDGELAVFYFDAINLAQPKLTVYAFNGTNLNTSWQDGSLVAGTQAPDKILSSVAASGSAKNPAGWIKQLIAVNEPDGSRTLGFVIDTTIINAHSPLYPAANMNNAWKGAKFGSKIGIWFHPMLDTVMAYGADGFLTNFNYSVLGWYDGENTPTVKEDPICTYTFADPKVDIGKLYRFIITATDNQGNNLKVDYSGVPVGANISPASGVTGTAPTQVNFNWTPSVGQAGQTFNMAILFTDPYGATASCPISLVVPPNKPPLCYAQPQNLGYQNLSCSGATTTIKLDGSASIDPELGTQGLFYVWSTNCPAASFDNVNSVTPTLTFKTENPNNTPVSCTASLLVSDGKDYTQCGAAISVRTCVRDCAGTINGISTFDQCGTCAGNGKSCLDCKNLPFGGTKIDVCGVCGGDGSSCACKESSVRELLFTLDNSAKEQAALVVRAAKRLALASNGDPEIVSFVTSVKKEANALYIANWSRTWSIQQVSKTCPSNSPEKCVSSSNEPTLNTYNTNSKSLFELTRSVLREVKIRKMEKKFKDLAKYQQKAKGLYDAALQAAKAIPSSYNTCS